MIDEANQQTHSVSEFASQRIKKSNQSRCKDQFSILKKAGNETGRRGYYIFLSKGNEPILYENAIIVKEIGQPRNEIDIKNCNFYPIGFYAWMIDKINWEIY